MTPFRAWLSALGTAAVFCFCSYPVSAQLRFELDLTDTGINDVQRARIRDAARMWESRFSDDITVRVKLVASGSGFAEAQTSYAFSTYSDFRTRMNADKTSAVDDVAVASLPTGNARDLYLNRVVKEATDPVSNTPRLDNDDSVNNQLVALTRANAKALGLLADNPQVLDGTIFFNSNFQFFDYDTTDGIDGDKLNFAAIIAHEFGHTLGFVSTADIIDQTVLLEDGVPFVQAPASPTSLDMFRYSEDSRGLGAVDITADRRAKYFSLDGGQNALYQFETGVQFGSGFQASHWKNGFVGLGNYIGIMDPQAEQGQLLPIMMSDITAFDAIGYDVVVPAPPAVVLFALGSAGIGWRARRRNRKAN